MISRRAEYLLNTINADIDARNNDEKLRQKENRHKEWLFKQQTEREERMAEEQQNRETEQQIAAKVKNKKNQRQRINYDDVRTRQSEHELGKIMEMVRRRNRVYE